jgi:NADPH:quinone reductase
VFGNSTREPSQISFIDFAMHGGHDARIVSYFSALHAHLAGRHLQMLVGLVAAGRLDPGVGLEAGWEDLNRSLDALAGREVSGKVVLSVR